MIGFGFSVFTQAILGLGGGFRGSALNLDFTSGNRTLDPRITFSRTTNATLTNSAGLVAYAPHNLLTFSEQFDNAAWTKQNVTVTANATTAPDGATTADSFVGTSATSAVKNITNAVFMSAVPYVFSCHVKNNGGNFIQVLLSAQTGRANFDISTGAVGSTSEWGSSATITSLGGGWFRITVAFTPSAAATNYYPIMAIVDSSSAARGAASTSTAGFFLWGAQLELGSTATTYNPTTVKNLLGFTEHFDNAAWIKSNASITSGFTDIYGQPFAQKLVENTATDAHRISQTVTMAASTYTASVYAKAGERTQFGFSSVGGRFPAASFDLVAVTATVLGTTSAATITFVGNGWYRCTATRTVTAGSEDAQIRLIDAAGNVSYTGDGTSGIYIFGAQLSDSASVDPYVYQPVAAPSSVAYYGPRFDYDPVTLACKGLLIEEQRTNLLLNSAAIGSTYWSNGRTISFLNSAVAPDGTSTATKVAGDPTQAGNKRVFGVSTTVVSSVYTASVYAKAGEITSVKIAFATSSESEYASAIFNLSDGTVTTGAKGAITPVGDDWYRCSVFGTATSTTSAAYIYPIVEGTSGFTGDGVSGVYLWGAQLEAGAFATSYIPTVASQVTRAADSASMIGNNFARWYNQTEGTLFGESSFTSALPNAVVGTLNDGSGANAILLDQSGSGMRLFVRSGGINNVSLTTPNILTSSVKCAGAYKTDDAIVAGNGGLSSADTSVVVPFVNRLDIGRNVVGGNTANFTLKRIAYYPRRLTNAELQGITS